MKGKKFNATEKHFQEKEIKLRQEVTHYKTLLTTIKSNVDYLSEANTRLHQENCEIKEKYEKLLEYSKFSDDDIKSALDKDKTISGLGNMLISSSYFKGLR